MVFEVFQVFEVFGVLEVFVGTSLRASKDVLWLVDCKFLVIRKIWWLY